MSLLDRNSIIYLLIIAAAIFLAIQINPFLILLWPFLLFLDDVSYFFLGKSVFDTEIAIQRGYQFAYIFLDGQSNEGRDLGFNLYDGDLSKSLQQSQKDKWDFVLQ
ncbi:hypothetical protein MNBD_CHLOROFLEXI01-317 [hydrothermal vent metagenome]|uniref:Uncharacterized protein n=1 Tax=hydrothermal vent metagenome TaxID=652676 RepID=A0A3B0V3P2_9ZZZZ